MATSSQILVLASGSITNVVDITIADTLYCISTCGNNKDLVVHVVGLSWLSGASCKCALGISRVNCEGFACVFHDTCMCTHNACQYSLQYVDFNETK